MRREFRMEYLKKIHERYQKAGHGEKQRMLDEFCQVCHYHRKYAIRLLNSPLPEKTRPKRPKKYKYGSDVISVLTAIWEASGYLWSQRLKAALTMWIPWARRHCRVTPQIEKQLLTMGSATMDRRLKDRKVRLKRRIYGTTRPGTLLKHQIPIKTDSWDVKVPGFMEVDLISHSGPSADGEFIQSLNTVDIQTTWTEARAVWGKGQRGVIEALEDIADALPFRLRGIDSDNGSEFINHHLKAYCDQHTIQFTRGRPYKKDDNAHVEQKNWTQVRKIMGYDRYDRLEALLAMNDLYRTELRLMQNLFQPSVKLIRKERIGSKLKRIYDKPKTPFQRVCECKDVRPEKIRELKALLLRLDPFELSKRIDEKLERIWRLASIHRNRRGGLIPQIHTIHKREKEAKREKITAAFGYILG